MSLIQKILASECLDPCAEVRFVVVLRCSSPNDIDHCHSVFGSHGGEIHVEDSDDGQHFLFIAEAGADIDALLLVLNGLLDEPQAGVELVETKVINNNNMKTGRHSFVFKQDGLPDATTIILSPSHAFGSGDHPSTGLAIEFLEELVPLEGKVLDVGCGTGVLSFVALRLGAQHVLGIDIDEQGLACAEVNATLNQVADQVQFENKELTEVSDSFPLILANLTCSVLKYLLKDLSALASPQGTLVVSGLQGRQGDEAEGFLAEHGWQVTGRKSAGKWRALLAVRR